MFYLFTFVWKHKTNPELDITIQADNINAAHEVFKQEVWRKKQSIFAYKAPKKTRNQLA